MVALGLGTAVLLRMFRLKDLSTLQAVCSSYHCFLKSQNLPSCFNEIKCAISSIIVGSCPIKSMTIFFSSVAKCVVVLSHLKLVPAAADCGNAEETAVPFFCISVQKEVCVTHLHRLPFAFSEQT